MVMLVACQRRPSPPPCRDRRDGGGPREMRGLMSRGRSRRLSEHRRYEYSW